MSFKLTRLLFNHSPYGFLVAYDSFNSSSSINLPLTVSTKSIRPGLNLSFTTIFAGSISRTPTSDERISWSSSVM